MLVLSGAATGLSWLCYYRALQLAPASKVAPVDNLSVTLVIVLAVVFLGEPLTWRVAVGGGRGRSGRGRRARPGDVSRRGGAGPAATRA